MQKTQLVKFLGVSLVAITAACGGAKAHVETNPQPTPAPTPAPTPEPPPPPAPVIAQKVAKSRVELTAEKIVIKEKVQFDAGKATIKPESKDLLDEIAKVFADNPQIKKVEIQGHASGEGDPKANTKLSDERAKSVLAALTSRNVKAEVLAAKGYGSERKIVADEKTEDDREQNRRVEFVILDPAPKKGGLAGKLGPK